MMDETRPTNITADRPTKQLRIDWDNGKTCLYPFGLLRNACPCAECRGGHENMRKDPDPDIFELPLIDTRASMIRSISLVGNYALNIEWEDGHHFGIYNWAYLLALCPPATE
jgi:DUF971 family protein